MKVLICVVFLGSIACSLGTNVTQCHDVEIPYKNIIERVKVGACNKPPCRLRKNSKVDVEIKFVADRDAPSFKNSVQSFVSGVPLPFPGFDQTDGCQYIYSVDGKTKLGCPVKKGEEYLYKTSIEVLQIYPRLKIVVHWGLVAPDGKYLFCFETPARITN